MNEYTRAATWLYATLTTPPIAGVTDAFEDDAPAATTGIWITFETLAPGDDVKEVAEHRIWTEFAFEVMARARTRDTVSLQAIADEIDSRLHRASGTTTDGRIIQSSRQQDSHESTTEDGIDYRALGGIYNLIVQPLSA